MALRVKKAAQKRVTAKKAPAKKTAAKKVTARRTKEAPEEVVPEKDPLTRDKPPARSNESNQKLTDDGSPWPKVPSGGWPDVFRKHGDPVPVYLEPGELQYLADLAENNYRNARIHYGEKEDDFSKEYIDINHRVVMAIRAGGREAGILPKLKPKKKVKVTK